MNYVKKIFIFITLISVIFFSNCKSQQNVTTAILKLWERHWGSEENDIAEDMVITGNNIYVTGVTLGELDGTEEQRFQ